MKALYMAATTLIICFVFSCSERDKAIKKTIKLSGEHGSELIKVLNHYKDLNDTLGLKAARFILENMAYQFTVIGGNLNELDSIYALLGSQPKWKRLQMYKDYEGIVHRKVGSLKYEPDVRFISAEMLIRNIDWALESYRRFEHTSAYDFDTFCEYILPYKVGREDTSSWRGSVLKELEGFFGYLYFDGGRRVNLWERESMTGEGRALKITNSEVRANDWESQFFLTFSPAMEVGEKYMLTMDVRADVDVSFSTQAHTSPGNYKHWDLFGTISATTEWTTFVKEITITENTTRAATIAFNLGNAATNYYFDNIKLTRYNENDGEPVWNLVSTADFETDDAPNYESNSNAILSFTAEGEGISGGAGTDSSSGIHFNVQIDERSVHDILIYYNALNDSGRELVCEVAINGELLKLISMEPTESLSKSAGKIFRLTLELNEGKNHIAITNLSEDHLHIDYIEFLPSVRYNEVAHFDNAQTKKVRIKNRLIEGNLSMRTDLIDKGTKIFISSSATEWDYFHLDYSEFGYYQISPTEQTQKLTFDMAWQSKDLGNFLHLWENARASNQKWAIVTLGNGYFKIVNKLSGLCLDVKSYDSTIVQQPYRGLDSQMWQFESPEGDVVPALKEWKMKPLEALFKMVDYSKRFEWDPQTPGTWDAVKGTTLIEGAFGSCVEEAKFQTYVLRAMGIGSTVDFVMNWASSDLAHHWNVFIDEHGNTIPNVCCEDPYNYHRTPYVYKKKGKVYRMVSTPDYDGIFLNNPSGEEIPAQFQNAYVKDVTSEYCKVADVDFEVGDNDGSDNRFVYLMVFDNRTWRPTAWGKRNGRQVHFKDVEIGIVYLPAWYEEGRFQPFSYPIILDDAGNVQKLIPGDQSFDAFVVKRKFPYRVGGEGIDSLMVGGVFEVSNDRDFKNTVLIGEVTKDMTSPNFHYMDFEGETTFKYLRYRVGPGVKCSVNEVKVFNENGKLIQGHPIGFPESPDIAKVFDGDVLTNYETINSSLDSWVGLQFSEPTTISRIGFAPRNDGNFIEVGDQYELVYWESGRWKSIGGQTAASDFLIFRDVPKDGLYLLHNHTKGKEERVFTYENGKQVWW